MSMYQHTVPTFIRLLTNLNAMLKKAEANAAARKFDANVLLTTRLAPDMYPFTKQIQIATDMAKGCVARLAGQDPPKFEDNETTMEQLHQRINKTIEFIKSVKPESFSGCEDRRITLPWAPDKYMMGSEYVDEMALPNFYFHCSMAYALLRHNGVDVGKGDFLGDVNMRS